MEGFGGRILDKRLELMLQEVLGIVKKEFHETILNLIERKQLLTEQESEKPDEVKWPTSTR